MSARLEALIGLPSWPRCLSREQAAAYVGVSATLFDQEVGAGLWPAGQRRGGRGGRITWDKSALDRRLDVRSGLAAESASDGDSLEALDWSGS